MKGRPITDQGARALAAAVALQACLDWRLLQQVVSGTRRPWPVNGLNMSRPQEELRKLEQFFLGGWYETLTDHRGDVALALLQRDERTKRHQAPRQDRPAGPPETGLRLEHQPELAGSPGRGAAGRADQPGDLPAGHGEGHGNL